MDNIELTFENIGYTFPLIFIKGTNDKPFLFGTGNDAQQITVKDFFISKFTVTQILYEHLMGYNPSHNRGNDIPVETVSYDDIVMKDGFLEKINSEIFRDKINRHFQKTSSLKFRLPSETEWEYAAKGGMYWTDNFIYSGSNDINEVAWYQNNSLDEKKPVGQKKPNQSGIHDMSGNVWEWCEDYYHEDINKTPKDGSPCVEKNSDRVLRGGCFHNWAIHCTSTKRYSIMQEYKDPCIGFRLVLSF